MAPMSLPSIPYIGERHLSLLFWTAILLVGLICALIETFWFKRKGL